MWKITTEKFKEPKEGGAYLSERTRIVPERHIHPKSVLIDLSKVDKDTASHIRKVIERHKGKAVTYGQITICVLFVIAITIGAVMDCANKDFYSLKLHNNIVAQNLSSVELITFLEQDPTNEHEVIEYRHKDCFAGNLPTDASRVGIYDESKSVLLGIETLYDYVTSGYMCINYATDLHNNAEKAGIRCAVADNNNGHVLNAFITIDRGLVFVDASAGSDSLSVFDEMLGVEVIYDCIVRSGVGDSFTEFLGDTDKFTITW